MLRRYVNGVMVVAAYIAALLMVAGCTSVPVDPNAPPLTQQEQQVQQMQKAIDVARSGLSAYRIYILFEGDDWTDDKLALYQAYGDQFSDALDEWQAALDRNDIGIATLKQIAVDNIIKTIEEQKRIERERRS